MPTWVTVILSAAAVVTAIGVLWAKVVKPVLIGANRAEEMYHMQVTFMAVFKDAPQLLPVLKEIALQFKTNHGSSLRDVVNDIASAAEAAVAAATVLEVNAEAARQLSERDRQHLIRLEVLLDRLDVKVDQSAADDAVVAEDLRQAHERAEGAPSDVGAAADAAVKPPPQTGR